MTFYAYITFIDDHVEDFYQSIESYIVQFSRQHSWYKHLSWEETSDFVFFVNPETNSWDFYRKESGKYPVKNYPEYLSKELVDTGTVGLTAFIHGMFESQSNTEYQLRHNDQINQLRETLNQWLALAWSKSLG
jgi:hypothetical protein